MSGRTSPEMKHAGRDSLGRPVPTDITGDRILASDRLLLMSRVAARRGDKNTAYDLTDQVEQMGITIFEQGAEDAGYSLIEASIFYEELNGLTMSGKDTPKNIAALYRSYGFKPPED